MLIYIKIKQNKIKLLLVIATFVINNIMAINCYAVDYYGGFTELKQALNNTSKLRNFYATKDIDLTTDLGDMKGNKCTLNLYGYNFYMDGKGLYSGIGLKDSNVLNIYDFKFVKNFYDSSSGVVIDSSAEVNIYDTYFENNEATGNQNGGAIFNSGTLTVQDSTFKDNIAGKNGGAIASPGEATITDCTFTGNVSTGGTGGAFCVPSGGGEAVITGCTFTSNRADTGNGGAVRVVGSSEISDSTFTSNTTGADGGGVCIESSGDLILSGSTFTSNTAADNGGGLENSGNTTITNTNFTDNTSTSGNGGGIYTNNTLNIIADGKDVTFSGNTAIGESNAIYFDGGTLNFNAGNGGDMIFDDKIDSSNIANTISINKTGVATNAPTDGKIQFNETVSNTTLALYNGTLALGNDTYINSNNMALNGGLIDMRNSAVGTASLNNITLTDGTTTNIAVDIDFLNSKMDKFTAVSLGAGTGVLNIETLNVVSNPTIESISLPFTNDILKSSVETSITTYTGPIYVYDVFYSKEYGSLNFINTYFTPSVLAAAIAIPTGVYFGTLGLYNLAINNSGSVTANSNSNQTKQNKKSYSGQHVPQSESGLWFDQYTTFDNTPLVNGPKVSSINYGSIIGGSSEVRELRNGYKNQLSFYVGYNNSRLNYSNVAILQNGASFGLMSALSKKDFFLITTGMISSYLSNVNTIFGQDEFTTISSGLALNTGYNFKKFNDRITIQPNILTSYTNLNTVDYKSASNLEMKAPPLNAIQVSPGIKLINNISENLQSFITVSSVNNFMKSTQVSANDVALPSMSIRPYMEYGIGIGYNPAKKYNGYLNVLFRSGGREGIGFKFGFNIALGKEA